MNLTKQLPGTMLSLILFIGAYKTTTAQTFAFARQLSGTGYDDAATAITVDVSGNIFTTGFFQGTSDFNPGAAIYNLTSAGSYDVFITKFDPSGDFLWAKQIGGINPDRSYAIAVDESGSVYTAGYFKGTVDFDPGLGTFNLTDPGGGNCFISKLDPSGNFVWAKQMGGNSYDGVYELVLDTAGNIYTTGYFSGIADFDPGTGTFNLTSAGSYNFFISKLDPAGNFIWAKQMGGTGSDIGRCIAVDASGNIYITGLFEGTADFDPGPGTINFTAVGINDIAILKLDPSGNLVWAKQIGDTSVNVATSIAVDANGNLYATGYFVGTVDFDPDTGTFHLNSFSGSYDKFLLKLDPLGNFVWVEQVGGTGTDLGLCISLDANGNIYTTGSFSGTSDFDPGAGTYHLTSFGGYDLFISKSDTSGNFVWTKQIGGISNDKGISLTTDDFGNIYTTGAFYDTVDFDPGLGIFNLISAGNFDVFISKLSNVTTSTYEIYFGNNIKLYPNPNSGNLTIELEKNFTLVQVSIKDMLGREILSKKYFSTSRIYLDMKDATAGIYFIEIKKQEEIPVTMKIIKE